MALTKARLLKHDLLVQGFKGPHPKDEDPLRNVGFSASPMGNQRLQRRLFVHLLGPIARVIREEPSSIDQCRSRLKLSEKFERHWSILISGEIHMDQSLVHTFCGEIRMDQWS